MFFEISHIGRRHRLARSVVIKDFRQSGSPKSKRCIQWIRRYVDDMRISNKIAGQTKQIELPPTRCKPVTPNSIPMLKNNLTSTVHYTFERHNNGRNADAPQRIPISYFTVQNSTSPTRYMRCVSLSSTEPMPFSITSTVFNLLSFSKSAPFLTELNYAARMDEQPFRRDLQKPKYCLPGQGANNRAHHPMAPRR